VFFFFTFNKFVSNIPQRVRRATMVRIVSKNAAVLETSAIQGMGPACVDQGKQVPNVTKVTYTSWVF